ncbi:Zinc finger, CCHC-type superfamily [Sesbania bispinosa]|nr:Zinc finger, CCHC-type superfamily [Sesbania bispinosa]
MVDAPLSDDVYLLTPADNPELGASSSTSTDQQIAFTVQGSPSNKFDSKSKNVKKDRPTCTHCGLLGHTVDKCYKIHGYPPGHPKSKNKVANPNNVIHQVSGQLHASPITDQSPSSNIGSCSNLPFTTDQCQLLLSLLSSQLNAQSTPTTNSVSTNHNSGSQRIEDDWEG